MGWVGETEALHQLWDWGCLNPLLLCLPALSEGNNSLPTSYPEDSMRRCVHGFPAQGLAQQRPGQAGRAGQGTQLA